MTRIVHKTSLQILSALSVVAMALGTGCASAQKPLASKGGSKGVTAAATPAPGAPAPGATLATTQAPGPPIYFDFDSDLLKEESKPALQQMAKYLAEHAGEALTIEGHCDDLGASEYNLALGDRRARAAVDYLVRLGVSPDRLRVLSFGEEKPAVANDDDAHRAQNRRGVFERKG